ncbi:MAG: hypothetical protein JST00_20765 [Deltaproteobacteria bacterium]|nr:hypothetical protein [Deltaproteobacteria bacterium]
MSVKAAATAALAAIFFASANAGAEETNVSKAECVAALDKAQSLQTARKLKDARASYLACSTDACPELVREDCAKSLLSLEGTMPTVVFSAKMDDHDVSDARVLLDGEAVANALDGHAVALDPGNHVARFERKGGGAIEVKLVAREGEKNRAVTATFPGSISTKPLPKMENGSHFPLFPVILGSAGLLAIGGSFVFRANASADADEYRRTCAPTCDLSVRDELSDKLVVANVALGVGIGAVAVAAATWLFDTRH